MIIGVTGGSGTGKSSLAQSLANLLNYRVINADIEYCELGSTNTELKAAINDKIPLDGSVVINATMLFSTGLNKLCDITVAILARDDVRTKRLINRDGRKPKEAEEQINAQPKDEFFIANADYTVLNNSDDINDIIYIVSILNKQINMKKKIEPKIAIYGGTFDPPTAGHLDIIKRSANIFNNVYVVFLFNDAKKSIVSIDKRMEWFRMMIWKAGILNVEVEQFNGLLAEYAYKKGAKYSIRGIRNSIDVEYERPMAEFNKQIAYDMYNHNLETIFLTASCKYLDTSSSNVRMIITSGAPEVAKRLLDNSIADEVISQY